jgi:hypothetical protein
MKCEKSIFLKMENGLDSLLFSDANVFFTTATVFRQNMTAEAPHFRSYDF